MPPPCRHRDLPNQLWLFDACPVEPSSSSASIAIDPDATLSLSVLGSGSGGNASLLRLNQEIILLDAGLGPRTLGPRIEALGHQVSEVRAICLTHMDSDHFRSSWIPASLKWNIAIHIHRRHERNLQRLRHAERLYDAGLVRPFDASDFEVLPGLRASPIRFAHDACGTSGFRLISAAGHIGYATDLGTAPPELPAHFAGVDLLAIESNYDPEMQRRSSRPMALKRRIMGGTGHLSNEEAFEAVKRIVERSPAGAPRHIVLLHRSAQCNTPHLVRETFSRDPRIAPRIVLSEQRHYTDWLHIGGETTIER